MSVRVEYTGQIRYAAKTASEEFDISTPCSLLDLVGHVVARHGAEVASHLLDAQGSIRSSLLVTVDHQVVDIQSPAQLLHDSCVVTLLPPIAGG